MPAVVPVGEKWTSVRLLFPPLASLPRPPRVIRLAVLADLIVGRESDVMPRLCTLVGDNGRVSLSCVAWYGGTPTVHRLLALNSGFIFLWLFRVGGVFPCCCLPGSPFLVSCLPIFWFGPVFPVTYSEGEACQWMQWSTFGTHRYNLLVILEVDDFKLLLSVVGACVHHV